MSSVMPIVDIYVDCEVSEPLSLSILLCFFRLVCQCFVCVGMSLFFRSVPLHHICLHACTVCVSLWERQRDGDNGWLAGHSAGSVLKHQQAQRKSEWLGGGWLEILTHSLQHTDSPEPHNSTIVSQFRPLLSPLTHPHALVFQIIPDVAVQSLSLMVADETQSCVCIDSFLFVLFSLCPITIHFHFSPALPPKGRGGADVCLYALPKCISTMSTS